MSVHVPVPRLRIVALIAAAVAFPTTAAAQGNPPPPDGCSDCDFCPNDPDKIAFYDNFQNDSVWLPQSCYDGSCGISCGSGDDDVDLDVLAVAVKSGDWRVVVESLDMHQQVTYNAQRNAIVVGGCRGAIGAVLPLPNDASIVTAISIRAYRAAQRRALTAGALLAQAAA